MEFDNKINVASSELGTRVISTSDEFFAAADRMLMPSEPVFIDGKFDDHGKWMDGWETRRRRDGKNDYCFIELGRKSIINGFNIDTSHFTGNFPPGVSILGGCFSKHYSETDIVERSDDGMWFDLVCKSNLKGDSDNYFSSINQNEVTHLKVSIYPDGGIARLRAYGSICFDDDLFGKDKINVIASIYGARAVYANDEHFGNLQNILSEREPLNMGDGWETRRRREPGNDWGVIELPRPASISGLVVDTKFFKGNYPDSFSISAANISNLSDSEVVSKSDGWSDLVTNRKLKMNKEHTFNQENIEHQDPITHVRVNIFPDGGIARLKLIGTFVKL
ncbi:MAG TPA: allantoicase [Gammaproteobacteria bacterium]|jgi:allantoicase|nr:allantoicase [Gammaproteobacteria bacterium]